MGCALEAEISELKSRCNGMDMKEQLLREAIHDLQSKKDTLTDEEIKKLF